MALFVLNAALTKPLFLPGEAVYRGSIEAGYASMARFVAASPNPWGWNPTQYCGLPTQFTYLPALPYLTAGLIRLGPGWDPAHIYRIVVATLACLGPVTLFLLVLYFTKDYWWALAAALGYTFLSASYGLFPQADADRGFVSLPWRLHVLAKYGEGPHTAGLVLLPLALTAVWAAATGHRYRQIFLAAVALAAVTLTNWIAALALGICFGLLLLAGLGTPGFRARRVLASGVLAYLLTCFWLTPRFVRTVALNWPADSFNYQLQVRQALVLAGLVAGLAILRLLFVRWPGRAYLCFLALAFFTFAYIVASYYWFGVDVIPESRRYALEFELFLFALLFELVRFALDTQHRGAQLGALGIAGLLLWTTGASRPWQFVTKDDRKWEPVPQERTLEFQLARRIADRQPKGRIFAFGGVCFRLNSWYDIPQVGGVFESGLRNRMPVHFSYQVRLGAGSTADQEGPNAVLQLRAVGAEYLVTHGPQSKEYYHDFKNQGILEGLAETVYSENDDRIYRLPFASLAHLVRSGELPSEPPLLERVTLLRPYVAAMDDAARPKLLTQWNGTSELRIDGPVPEGMQVALQVSHDWGWRATQDGEQIAIRRNQLGFMTIEARPAHAARIVLQYHGTNEQRVMAAISLLAWAAAIGGLFVRSRG